MTKMRGLLRKLSSHKYLLFIGTLLILVLLTAGLKLNPRSNLSVTDNLPHAQQYEDAIKRGLRYLDHNSANVSPLQWLVIDYLQRQYSLGPQFSVAQRNIQPPTNEPDATDFRVYYRIIDPSLLVDSLPTTDVSPMRQMLMAAAHCDHIPLPPDYENLLESNIKAGEYSLTHVAFALELMKDNKCSLAPGKDQQIHEIVATDLAKLVDQDNISEDLRYEAIAFLLHMGRSDLTQARWLNQITAAQRPDGGWPVLSQDKISSDHATVVALWALLEYTKPNTPKVPMIRHAGYVN